MRSQGFTLIEIMIAVSVLGLASTLAAPSYVKMLDTAKGKLCVQDRQTMVFADQRFNLENSRHATDLTELFLEKYLKKIPACNSGGSWVWDAGHENILCSIHDDTFFQVTGTTSINVLDGVFAGRWFQTTDSIYTFWGNQTVHYNTTFETAGEYEISVSAKNFNQHAGWTRVAGYSSFHIRLYIDGRRVGTIFVPASDTEYKIGSATIPRLTAGHHRISLQWANDAYRPSQHQDSNIQISRITLRKTGQD